MRGNTIGKMLSMTTFGESHGMALGVVLDGMPSKLKISQDNLDAWVAKRRPGFSKGTTGRQEEDRPQILSGIFENMTLGTPISIIVENKGHKSSDYKNLKNIIRPGHADQVTLDKYGIRDHRGGGRSSGRETVSRVIAGYFASLILPKLDIEIDEIILGKDKSFLPGNELNNFLENLKKENDSIGGELKLTIKNCPKAIGEPVFDKLKADLAKAMLSIGGCTSFHLGDPFNIHIKGSELIKEVNFLGGIQGGISTGDLIKLTLGFKPPVSIGNIAKEGRHDPCIIPRAIPVVDSMVRFIIADHYLRQNAYEE